MKGEIILGLIKCPICHKEISSNVKHCPKCYEPINEEDYEFRVAYEYNGEIINSPLFRAKIEEIKAIRMIGKVSVYDKVYMVKDAIYDSHKDIIHFILDRE